MNPVEIYLKAYLEQLEAQLGDLPPKRRAEILAETRSHLEAMMLARRADGMDEGDAWRSARNAFGDADPIGRELAREWKRAPRVETVGTPLSRREKIVSFTRPVALSAFFLALFSIGNAPQFQGQWRDVIYAFMTLAVVVLGLWRWRKRGGQWSFPLACFLAGGSVAFAGVYLDSILGIQSHGTRWNTIFQLWPYLSFVLMAIAIPWFPRTIKTAFPWRRMPLYAQNPIAAEELYRLSPKIQLLSMTVTGCLLWLFMGWQFLGFRVAAAFCLGEVALAYLYARWLDRQMR